MLDQNGTVTAVEGEEGKPDDAGVPAIEQNAAVKTAEEKKND